MKFSHTIICCFLTFISFAQTDDSSKIKHHQIERFIIYNQLDSASYYLKKMQNNSYKDKLKRIINEKDISYLEYQEFTSKLANDETIDYKIISNYINENVKKPVNFNKINLDYVYLKWCQISTLRDDGDLEAASTEQKKLETYIYKFDDRDEDVLRAKTRIKTHDIVMFLIEKDLKNGKKLALENLKIAEELNDITLQIPFLSHYSDFLVYENKLDEYIEISERCLNLEKKLPKNSQYYYSTISHLVDAYIYKGGYRERVKELIDELYNSNSRDMSYVFYAQLLSVLEKNAPLKKEILKKFAVNDVSELAAKFLKLGENLSPNEYFSLVNMNSKALAKHGFYEEALSYKTKAIEITRKIYSEDLSKSLAKHRTEQALKSKVIEINTEKHRAKLFSVIAFLSFIFFVITLLILTKIKKQSKELSHKNLIIKETLAQKELLIKEVHHRVKNNFQIVESLLDFQSDGVEDERAIQLFNDGKNRVKSMALIHQKLYNSEHDLINFNEYICLLIKEISFIYHSEVKVSKTIKVDDIFFDVDTATPLGLIINEIVTNAFKYAFNSTNENKLLISIHQQKDDSYKLIIEDNGVGISEDFDIEKSNSLGLRLVKRLVKQLHGSFKLTRKNGTKCEIIFKDSDKRNHIE